MKQSRSTCALDNIDDLQSNSVNCEPTSDPLQIPAFATMGEVEKLDAMQPYIRFQRGIVPHIDGMSVTSMCFLALEEHLEGFWACAT